MGEPPTALHPVAWMGRCLDWLSRHAPCGSAARFGFGSIVAVALPALWCLLGAGLERRAPWPVKALALVPTFAGRGLLQAGQRVESALLRDDLPDARVQLAWLVSRPTDTLDAGLAAAAAIESLAENLVDSWLAPLLAYSLFGLGGAYAYRAANTADAMWGYRTSEYEWLGKAVARLDDVLNFLPARLAAVLLIWLGPRRVSALRTWMSDARVTPSPNAGQPMAAIAGQLEVRLEKPGVYVLNASACAPTPADITRARSLVARAMFVSGLAALALRGVRQRV